MPFSSGVYSLYTPGNPTVTGTTVSSTWANNTFNDVATALSTCVLKDGTQTVTANIPLNNFKLTGVGAPTVTGDALSEGRAVGATTPAAGAFTTLVPATIHTDSNTTSCLNATATTLLNPGTSPGLYLVFAFISSAGAANYTASSTFLYEGSDARQVGTQDGALLTLTLSGTSIQATQNSGITADVAWRYIRIN